MLIYSCTKENIVTKPITDPVVKDTIKKDTIKKDTIVKTTEVTQFSIDSAASLKVDLANQKQKVIFMGGDMERSASAIQDSKNPTEILDWSFRDIPFNICRLQFDKNQEITEGVKNFAFYNKQLTTMKYIKSINPNIKLMACMRSDYDGYNQGDTNNLPKWIYNRQTKVLNINKYGIFLVEYLEYMHNQGVTIDYLNTAKEWTSVVKPDMAVKLIEIINTETKARNLPTPKIIDPASWSISAGIEYVNKLKQLGKTDQVFAFCTHNYSTNETKTFKDFFNAVSSTGKPAFQDETSTGASGRFPILGSNPPIKTLLDAYTERVKIYEGGFSGEIFFELWSRGVNEESRSIYFAKGKIGERRRAYYTLKEFAQTAVDANFIPLTFPKTPGVIGMAFVKNNKLQIWLINNSSNDINNFNINIKGQKFLQKPNILYWNQSTPDTGLSDFGNLILDNNIVNLNLSSQSITTIQLDIKP